MTADRREPCCDMHNRNCEPPSELCCWQCTEAGHPTHADGSHCIAPDLSRVGTSYDAIPRYVRDVLDEVYTPEGVVIWWNSRNRLMGCRPRDNHQAAHFYANLLADGYGA